MSRKITHAYAAFQRGKGLVGFLAGLVLATMIIIAVLLMLNSNSKTSVREPNLNQPVGTDKLSPTGVSQAEVQPADPNLNPTSNQTVPTLPASPVQMAADNTVVTDPSVPIKEDMPPVVDNGGNMQEPPQPADDNITNLPIEKQPLPPEVEPNEPVHQPTVKQPVRPLPNNTNDGVPSNVRPNTSNNHANRGGSNAHNNASANTGRNNNQSAGVKQDNVETVRKPAPVVKPSKPVETVKAPVEQPKPVVTPPKTVTPPKVVATPKSEPKKVDNSNKASNKNNDVKPTPQQILDAGNIEKARELARKQAAQGNKPAPAKPANTVRSGNSGAVVIQAGAFSSRGAAESQRARLALLGVQARIVEANVNGKQTFRVQTPRIEGAQANTARSLLQKHGVSTLERSAE